MLVALLTSLAPCYIRRMHQRLKHRMWTTARQVKGYLIQTLCREIVVLYAMRSIGPGKIFTNNELQSEHMTHNQPEENASSLLTSANVSSCTTPSINTQRDSAAVSGLLQDYINSSLSNSSAMMHSMNQSMNNVSENDNVNGSRNRSFQNIENRTTNQFQQHISSSNQQGISHHPNINSQVYSIPANSIQTNTPASETPTGTLTTSQSSLATSNSAQPTFQLTYQLLGIFHERPKYTDYAVVSRRFQSFESWPADHPIKKDDLIKSGLFFAGYGDCCRCFFCGGGLRNWEVEDDPFVEHARWFDKCSYIRQFMGHEFVLAVQSLKSRGGTITLRDVTEHMQAMGQTIQNLFADRTLTDDAAVRSLIDSGYDSESVVQAAQSLRDSGELLSADVILRQIREKLTGSGANATSGTESIPDDEGIPDQGRLQALKEENYALRSNLICKICMDKEVRIVFLPCGHLVSCQECAVALQDCPVCRSHIRATARANIR
uniref:RING-type domain-containing protein n=1 Tax=Arion vulgaris TaxID=1028688 RepID=A0A0B7AYB5_9EUPU